MLKPKQSKPKQKSKELQRLEQELFNTVYQWGRVGIQTDAQCPTFQESIAELYQQMAQENL